MAASVGAIVKKILLRWLVYLLGLVVVLGALGVGAFVLARPQIDEIVQREIKKRGAEVDGWDVGLSGRMNLHNLRVNLPDGAKMTASLAAVRPPIPGFSGAVTLYEVAMEHGSTSLTMPQLDIAGIEMHERDTTISSKVLQGLMQFDVSSLTVPHIRITTPIEGKEAVAQFEDLALDGFSQGKFKHFSLAHMTASLDEGATKLGSGGVELRDIDAAAAYAYLSGRLNDGWQPKSGMIIGPVLVRDITIDTKLGQKQEDAHFTMGVLRSDGLGLNPIDEAPLDLIQAIVKTDKPQEDIHRLVRLFAQSLAAFDVDMRDVDVEVGKFKGGLQSFTLKPDNWQQLVPQTITLDMAGLVLDASNLEGEEIETLKNMGYAQIGMSLGLDASFNKDARQLTLARLDIDVQNMGTAHMTGSFTNVDEAVFANADVQIAEKIQDITLHELNMTLKDEGATKNIVSFLTHEIDIEADEVMEHLETMITGTAEVLFHDAQQQKEAKEALIAFLRHSAELTIHMHTTGENGQASSGISLAALGDSLNDMRSLSEQLHLTFSSNGT